MIKELIEELSDPNKSLNGPLLKTKILASRLGSVDLLIWVNNELRGFDKSDIPDYRIAKSVVRGTLHQDGLMFEDQPVPVLAFGEPYSSRFMKFDLDQSVANLESIASGERGDTIGKQFGADFCAILNKTLIKNKQNFQISYMEVLVDISEVDQALSVIRSRLLDFVLELESEYPNLDKKIENNTVDKKSIEPKIIKIMNQTNITNTGDGNIVNTGDKAKINMSQKIIKGDVDALKKTLIDNEVSEEDANDLIQIVREEEPNPETKEFGEKTNSWIKKMFGKAVDGSWNVGIGAAGGLLASAIKAYFGIV